MPNKIRNVLIHSFIMIGIGAFFTLYFADVQNNIDAQNAIQENISIIPIGQLLAYEGYFGYVLLKWMRKHQQGNYENITKSNVVLVGGRIFHEYAISMVDLISITVITLTFFIVGYNTVGKEAADLLSWSNYCFLIVLPYLGFFSYWLLHIKK